MEKILRSVFGTIAGIFIMLALFQALLAVPEFNKLMTEVIQGMLKGLIIGSVIAAIIGIAFLYASIKGK